MIDRVGQLMESRTSSVTLAAKLRGWQQTLDAIDELSKGELEALTLHEIPRALDECMEAALSEQPDVGRLLRVLGKIQKALERRMRNIGMIPRH